MVAVGYSAQEPANMSLHASSPNVLHRTYQAGDHVL